MKLVTEMLRAPQRETVKEERNMENISFKNIQDGETFTVGGYEFIKFPAVDGKVPAVAKDILYTSRFGDNNDLTVSEVLADLQQDFLPKIIEAVGKETLCEIHTDLTTLDGLKPYPVMESLVSLPTFDFYRAHVEIFDKYPTSDWWWTATPESANPHDSNRWIVCVSPSGLINIDYYGIDYGVRPFLLFESSIFGA